MATAVLVSHSSSWPSALAKLDSVYDHLLDCYTNDSRGKIKPIKLQSLKLNLIEKITNCRLLE